MMGKIKKLRKVKFPLIILSVFILGSILTHSMIFLNSKPDKSPQDISAPLPNSITYESGYILIEDQTMAEDIIIKFTAIVSIVNSTLQGSIYMFNTGNLFILQNSNITQNVVISDYSYLFVDNSTIGGSLECRDTTTMELSECHTPDTTVWKFDSATVILNNSVVSTFNEFGIAGNSYIINSRINLVSLNGLPSSRTYITNSDILVLNDLVFPAIYITGPVRFNILTFNASYSTSERIINLTWIGWDSPVIDGFLNVTYQIFLDNQLYAEINGSGFYDQKFSSFQMHIPESGQHNITVVSIDSRGNKYTSTIIIEIINYPPFPWIPFFVVIALIIGIIVVMMIWIRKKRSRGYFSSLGTIFKTELAASKKKILILGITGVVPGVILFSSFLVINQLLGSIAIDGIRDFINMFFNIYIYYFGLIFSISVGAGSIAGGKKNGTFSWFFSKPVRRWEFLWGKILAFIVLIVITMLCVAISITVGAIFFVDPIYIVDILSIGGYIFLIGLIALLPLTALVVFSSSVFKKIGLAYVIPIVFFMALPSIISFLTILARSDWPMLFSFTYYFEQLSKFWISNIGGLFGSIGSYGQLLGITVTPLSMTPATIILIMSSLTVVFFGLATLIFQRQDIP
ncbi:MAG: ABC transporter permease [Candidatus Hermodarchaeota archaeon]